ncbi:MAG: SMP-30/gluconolactonase/LRE family protein [Balneolaceae bacterium]
MNYKISLFSLALILVTITSCANNDEIRIDLNSIVSEDATLEKVTQGYEFDTAGSPLYMNGDLYFTNNNFDSPGELSRTFRMNADGSIDTLKSGNNVTTTLKASGQGTIYACEMLGHRVVELDQNGQVIRVVVDEYNGTRIDGPNDLVVDQKGGLYFSDSQFIAGREIMQPDPSVYYVSGQGEITRVIYDVEFPNGLGLSPDGGTLYVANTPGTQILAYDVAEDGTVSNRRDFAAVELAEDSETSGADGMAIDSEGNLYVATTQGLGVQIFNSSGDYLGNIEAPTPTNNVSFGGEEDKILYISTQDGIYQISVNIEG